MPLENFIQDLRYGVRMVRRNPLFAAAAVITLGLGLGAMLAVFNVVNGVLLRPLPYRDPERINIIWFALRGDDGNVWKLPLSSGSYSDIERDSRSFEALAAFRAWPYAIAASADAEREPVAGARVSPALFDVLGVSPAVGRAFTRAEAVPGGPQVALISHDLWQRKFGGSRDIIGKRIYLGDVPFTLTGVMPPGFAFPRGAELPAPFQFGTRTDVWTPLVFDASDVGNYGVQNLVAIGKLSERCGTGACSASVAQAELTAVLRRSIPVNDQPKSAYQLVSMVDQAAERVRRPLFILLGAVAFVLAIAAANVTSLLVGRVHARERELAVRSALGATRGRLARQLVTETLVLCLLGMVVGLTLAFWGTKVMLSLVPGSLPRADDVGFDWRVLSFAGLLALIAALGFGVAAAYAARLRFTRAAVSVSSTRRVLVMTEVALSLVLLIGAALLTRSFIRLQQVRPGFDPSNALTARVTIPVVGRPQPLVDGARWSATFDHVMARLASAPGIAAAGGVVTLPLSGAFENGGVRPVGKVYENGKNPSAQVQIVAGDYFGAARIHLVVGRVFDASDDEPGRASMIVNRKFAREHFGSEADALGREVTALFEWARDRAAAGSPSGARGELVGDAEGDPHVRERGRRFVGAAALQHDAHRNLGRPRAGAGLRGLVRRAGAHCGTAASRNRRAPRARRNSRKRRASFAGRRRACRRHGSRDRARGRLRVDASAVIDAVRRQHDGWIYVRRRCRVRGPGSRPRNMDPGASRVAGGSSYGFGR